MNILVTGAAGFIGSKLCAELAGRDGYKVYALLREGTSAGRFCEAVVPVVYDGNPDSLIRNVHDLGIDGIVHLASMFLAQHTPADIDLLISSNILLGTHLIEAAAQTGVRWFINTSSFWQHYENRGYSPVALYAATKQAFEDILQYYRETTAVKIVTIELFDTYGPGDTRPKLFRLLKGLVDSPAGLAMSPGEQRMNLLYIDDVINAYCAMIDLLRDGAPLEEKYCASAAELPSLRQVVTIYSETVGSNLKIEWGGRPYRNREFMDPTPVYPLVPGWKQQYSLAEGIARMCRLDMESSVNG
jgi:nucleoside-diphosphate-sugar epimerase